jgi:hypothetical protein
VLIFDRMSNRTRFVHRGQRGVLSRGRAAIEFLEAEQESLPGVAVRPLNGLQQRRSLELHHRLPVRPRAQVDGGQEIRRVFERGTMKRDKRHAESIRHIAHQQALAAARRTVEQDVMPGAQRDENLLPDV